MIKFIITSRSFLDVVNYEKTPARAPFNSNLVTLIESKWNDLIRDIYRVKGIASVRFFYTTPSVSVE